MLVLAPGGLAARARAGARLLSPGPGGAASDLPVCSLAGGLFRTASGIGRASAAGTFELCWRARRGSGLEQGIDGEIAVPNSTSMAPPSSRFDQEDLPILAESLAGSRLSASGLCHRRWRLPWSAASGAAWAFSLARMTDARSSWRVLDSSSPTSSPPRRRRAFLLARGEAAHNRPRRASAPAASARGCGRRLRRPRPGGRSRRPCRRARAGRRCAGAKGAAPADSIASTRSRTRIRASSMVWSMPEAASSPRRRSAI